MINFDGYKIRPSKHFLKTWMRKWSLEIDLIKELLKKNYKLNKVGKYKYEVYIRRKAKSIKIIFVLDEEYKEIFIITGAEGK
jgi:hypothetical protein